MSFNVQIANDEMSITFNISALLKNAFCTGVGIRRLNGETGKQATVLINHAIRNLSHNSDLFKVNEQQNECGTIAHAITDLIKLREMTKANSRNTVKVF